MINIPITYLIFYALSSVIISLIILSGLLLLITKPYPIVKRNKGEDVFLNPNTNKYEKFPSLDDLPTIHLSVIVPAFDEEVRLPPMLQECIFYLGVSSLFTNFKYEIIIVSDGSRDKTVDVAHDYSKTYGSNKIRVLALSKNRGKGGAVRLGMLSARGAILLFADADGATKFSDLSKLEESLKSLVKDNYMDDPQSVANQEAIVIGSRAHLEDKAVATRSIFRTILMHGFHFLVWFFAVQGLRDTQCGFKLFTRKAARICFSNMHVERWAFDVELLYIAQKLKIPINEVAVNWTEIDGSKVTPVLSWIQMGRDLGLIWLRYKIGAWKIMKTTKKN